jgi:hypothetical protein
MPRTFGGLYLYNAAGLVVPTANVGVTAGLYSILIDASGIPYWGQTVAGAATTVFLPDNSNLTRPYITYPADPGQGNAVPVANEFKDMFGTAAGGPGNPFSGIAAGSTATAGTIQGSQFGTPPVPWGMAAVDVFAIYSVQTAALTAATIGLQRVIWSENVAEGVSTVLAPTALSLTTTTSATTPHVQKVSLAQPLAFENVDYSQLIITLSINAAATSVVRVYGIGMHVVCMYT